MTATCEPYVDTRKASMPFVVTLRSPRGGLVEHHRFADARAAWTFYLSHR